MRASWKQTQEHETRAQKMGLCSQVNAGKLILSQHSIEAAGVCKAFLQRLQIHQAQSTLGALDNDMDMSKAVSGGDPMGSCRERDRTWKSE